MQGIDVYVKGNRRAHVKDNKVVGYVGSPVTFEELDGTWTNMGEDIQTREVFGTIENKESVYLSLRSVGLSDVDAKRISGHA